MAEESAALLISSPQVSLHHHHQLSNPQWIVVHVPSTGLPHYTGISSSYSTSYPPALHGVISSDEFIDVMNRLNDTIRDYWPCNTCYFFGYGCCLCTAGLSVLIPNYCISHSELYATAMLRNVSLKAKYYDRHITFSLVKTMCQSYIEIRFPASLQSEENLTAEEDPAPSTSFPSPFITSTQPTRLKKL
jgi:hypothetical protein